MPVSAMTSNGKTKATPEVKLAVLGRAGVGKSGKISLVKVLSYRRILIHFKYPFGLVHAY